MGDISPFSSSPNSYHKQVPQRVKACLLGPHRVLPAGPGPICLPWEKRGGRGVPPGTSPLVRCRWWASVEHPSLSCWNECLCYERLERHSRDGQQVWLPVIVLPFLFYTSHHRLHPFFTFLSGQQPMNVCGVSVSQLDEKSSARCACSSCCWFINLLLLSLPSPAGVNHWGCISSPLALGLGDWLWIYSLFSKKASGG